MTPALLEVTNYVDPAAPEIVLTVETKMRLDKFLAAHTDFSRAKLQALISGPGVLVNDVVITKPSFILNPPAVVRLRAPVTTPVGAVPRTMPLAIVYEDEDLLVVNKPRGLVVHPAPGHFDDTLVNALVARYSAGLSSLNGPTRPGIVHRLDKDTSGLLLVAKHDAAHTFLAREMAARRISRAYYALVEGHLSHQVLHLELPIARAPHDRKRMAVVDTGRPALTHVQVLSARAKTTLVRCELASGRTHQIRVHLAYIKHPVVGDALYGTYLDTDFQRLHAANLAFRHPRSRQVMTFIAPLPALFALTPAEVALVDAANAAWAAQQRATDETVTRGEGVADD